MMIITSTSNPTIKKIHKLRDRKERQATGSYYLEGIRIVGEAVAKKVHLQTIVVAPELLTSEFARKMVEDARSGRVEVLEVSPNVFKYLSPKEGPQGIAAVAIETWHSLDIIKLASGDLWIALWEVADPGNLGTIIRTADATGCRGIILIGHCTDPYDLTAIRASMGALFSVDLVRCSLVEFQKWLREGKWSAVATSDHGKIDYHLFEYPDPVVLVMGSEREGLPDEILAVCNGSVRIPMAGGSDSLNLAVATGVCLYEIHNHRRDGKGKDHDSIYRR